MSGGRAGAVLDRLGPRLPALRHLEIGGPRGRARALNVGIAAARAPRIALLDEDNLYDPPHLARLVDGLESTGADYVYTGVRHATFTADGQPVGSHDADYPWSIDDVVLGNFVYATGSLFRRSLWERTGGYDERFAVFEDWDFVIRAAQEGTVAHLPGVSGTSRKFTGIPGVANFEFETAEVRRCLAGVYWKHRRLYRGERLVRLKVASAEHCRRRVAPRTGLLARSVAGWRLELGRDLLSWWWGNLVESRGRMGG